jgi:hypothetical protein
MFYYRVGLMGMSVHQVSKPTYKASAYLLVPKNSDMQSGEDGQVYFHSVGYITSVLDAG